jgi:hypothetical protein
MAKMGKTRCPLLGEYEIMMGKGDAMKADVSRVSSRL